MADAALPQAGPAAHATAWPHALSGGMQRRVALARALATNARLLLLDEPFVSLDRSLVAEIHDLFRRIIVESRPTVLFVSHLTDDAARLADRAILLDHLPATVVADIALPVAPGERDAAVLAEYRQALDSHFVRPGA